MYISDVFVLNGDTCSVVTLLHRYIEQLEVGKRRISIQHKLITEIAAAK